MERQPHTSSGGELQDPHLPSNFHEEQRSNHLVPQADDLAGPESVRAHATDRAVPAGVAAPHIEPADMAQVGDADWAELQALARHYCRKVDATRSRKRMDGSATIARDGRAPYGTDDVSDDVTQDAALLYAQRLAKIRRTCEQTAVDDETGEADAWKYIRKDGQTSIITRETIRRWAVHDAAARNGYRGEAESSDVAVQAGRVAVTSALAQQNEAIWRLAFGDGSEFPTLRELLPRAEQAANLKRAGVLANTAQALYGGVFNSSRNVRRVKGAALKEWQELGERLEAVRDELVYRGSAPPATQARGEEKS